MKKALTVIALTVVLSLLTSCSFFGGNASIDAAEKQVNHLVYTTAGIVCEKFDSKIIYTEGDIQFVAVKYYQEGSYNPGGSVCVCCKGGIVYHYSDIMAPDFPFDERIDELKALFGV